MAQVAIIAYGSTLSAVQEARWLLKQHSLPTAFMRIRSLPFGQEVGEFLDSYQILYVVELNRDGQMYKLLAMEFPDAAARLISLSYADGLPMTADWIAQELRSRASRI